MQVKLFTRASMSQSAFEQKVNDFMVTVNVIDLKISQSMADGDYWQTIAVLYEPKPEGYQGEQ